MDDIFLCHECGKVFYKLSTLESHTRWKHSDKSIEYMCDQCGRTFQKKYNLQKHIEVGVHQVAETVRCAAEECNFRAQNRKGMCSHYENYHGICLNETTVYFNNTKEFFDWKNEYETKTRARFVKMSSSRKRKNGIIKCTYLCHRDGNFIPKGKNIRHMKGKGSNKINAHCPAKMEVDISEKLVTVSYTDTHVGHDLDINRLSLNPSDKAEIAKLLSMQVPFEEILNDINTSARSIKDGNGVQRLNLLTRKDLWNIVETFKIDPKTVVYSKSRGKRRKQTGHFKSEAYEHGYWFEVVKQEAEPENENQSVSDAVEGDDAVLEDENCIGVYPILVKGENNEFFEEYTVVSDDNVPDDDERNCLIINAQGELESLNGRHIIYTEDGGIQIYESDAGYEDGETIVVDDNVVLVSEDVEGEDEMSAADEETVNVCEMTGTGEIIFIDNQTFKIEKGSDIEKEAVESILGFEEETITDQVNSDLEIKQEIYATEIMYSENDEENEAEQSISVENVQKNENLKYVVAEQGVEEDQVKEYVIISTEEEECNDNVLTEESNDLVKIEIQPQWHEKRKEALNKLLNVHSMINNEKQLTVLTKNISSLENVIKSLSEKDKQVLPVVGLES